MQTQDLVWKKSFLVHLMASWLWILLLLLACCLRQRRTTKPCTFSSIESFGQIALRHCRFPSRFSRFRLAQTRFSFELVDSHLSVLKRFCLHSNSFLKETDIVFLTSRPNSASSSSPPPPPEILCKMRLFTSWISYLRSLEQMVACRTLQRFWSNCC